MRKIIILITLLLLSSCQGATPTSSESASIVESESISEIESIESESSESVSESESEIISEIEIESGTEEELESESIEESESESEVISEEESEENKESEIPASGQTLPIGNKTVTGPENSKNPVDITNWVNFDLYDSLPTYFSYIQGNNKVNSRGDFYAPNAGGGFKFSKLYYGLQTPVFNSWKKLEIRFHISTVNNNNKEKDTNAPIFHIYGYNLSGRYIQLDYLEQGSITVQSEGSEVKIYVRNPEIAYLEFRLNAYPYKGSQCYNFGIDEISIRGWPYE